MKRKRFSETQIIKALKSHEAGVKVSEIYREMDIVEQTFYRWRAKSKNIVCDNGTEFASKAMFYWSRAKQGKLDFIQPGKATQNVFVESFNGKFRDNCFNQYWFHSLEDAKTTIENCRRDYNRVRPHSSLGYQPPSVFAEKSA